MLILRDITMRVGGRVLLDGASAQIPDGHRVGLVGRNGTGKTTLLRLILGEIAADGGDIRVGNRETVGTVAQEAPADDRTPIDHVLAADRRLAELTRAAETETDPNRIGELHARLADLGAHRAEARAARILAGLGFDDAAQRRPVSTYSGGWRMRVALAGALFAEPDILLLDEPTNHLDLESALWLESYLLSYPRTLILVSHDRGLLNRIPTEILHLNEQRLALYTGGYDDFEALRREQQAHQRALANKQEAQRQHIMSFVDRFRYKASKARQAQSRLKMLERMQPIALAAEDPTIAFNLPKPDILPPPILTLEDASAGYDPANPVLRALNLRIDMDDRIALLGANGNGKTTLLKLFAGKLKPLDGRVRKSSKLEVGYFAQNATEELDTHLSALEQLQALEPMATETKLRAHLGRFGFPQAMADTRIAKLSGGEKARLALALICRRSPHLLLMDEPTNHLDIDSRQALIEALAAYEGAVVIVTHDPYLVDATADRLWIVRDGDCRPFDGDTNDYRQMLERERRSARAAEKSAAAKPPSPLSEPPHPTPEPPKRDRRGRAEQRQKVAPLRKAAKDLEGRLEKLSAEKDRIDARLADPATYEGESKAIDELNRLSADLARAIEKTEEAWFAAQEALEQANGGAAAQ
ncbi:ABC-F family ATP-binding cassette domain-containing protein [Marivibrio halodurans]|uniref:ABC-F family ATP-binding cassette domain-containing protein n=1 Tax=Marivibrio halodurans TaxID=2039722 RepID=A0A8J7S5V0_9PROT|nr:ABC-F family ATP-binding cassette domain-containing protein [Marivibrio halodurans]MBP5856132.1 ABC-F family ATP-binding cassette domain-containing protein [Marivibrio halodurans]